MKYKDIYDDNDDEEKTKKKHIKDENVDSIKSWGRPINRMLAEFWLSASSRNRRTYRYRPHRKATKYEHIIPLIIEAEENPEIKGVLLIFKYHGRRCGSRTRHQRTCRGNA